MLLFAGFCKNPIHPTKLTVLGRGKNSGVRKSLTIHWNTTSIAHYQGSPGFILAEHRHLHICQELTLPSPNTWWCTCLITPPTNMMLPPQLVENQHLEFGSPHLEAAARNVQMMRERGRCTGFNAPVLSEHCVFTSFKGSRLYLIYLCTLCHCFQSCVCLISEQAK